MLDVWYRMGPGIAGRRYLLFVLIVHRHHDYRRPDNWQLAIDNWNPNR
jgi:hypothetical protein